MHVHIYIYVCIDIYIEGRRRREHQRMRRLGGINDTMDMSLSKLWEIAKDREACCAVVLGVTKSLIQLSNWAAIYTHTHIYMPQPSIYGYIDIDIHICISIYISLYTCLIFFFWNICVSLYVNRKREKHLKSGWICMKDIQKFYVLFFTLFHKSETTLNKFYVFYFFIFWPGHMACVILVPWAGIELVSPAMEGWSPNHWTTSKFPK